METQKNADDTTGGRNGLRLEQEYLEQPPRPKPRQTINPNAATASPSPSPSPRARGRIIDSAYPSAADDSVAKKPTIPNILHSPPPPVPSNEQETTTVKPSSILKKRKDSSGSAGPSVSFEVDESMTRTKSTDSNLSCESETGYWSIGSGSGEVPKEKRPILKSRRSSLGNADSESRPSELQSILKRKHSLDSSTLLRDTSSSPSSLSPSSSFCPILKNVSSSEDLGDESHLPPRSILKKVTNDGANATQTKTDEIVRPILKRPTSRGSRSEDDDDESHSHSGVYPPEAGKSILKRTPEQEISSVSVAERRSMLLQLDNVRSASPKEEPDKLIDDEYYILHSTTLPSVKSRRLQLLNSMLGVVDGGDRELPKKEESTSAGLIPENDIPVPPIPKEDSNNSFYSEPNSINNDETDTAAALSDATSSPERSSEARCLSENTENPHDGDDDLKSGARLIRERIAALKAEAEVNWLKRVPEKEVPELEILLLKPDQSTSESLDKKNELEVERRRKEIKSNLIANRLTLLEKSQEGWKKRVSEVDAANFTVQGRLEMAGKVTKSQRQEEKINKPQARPQLQTIQPALVPTATLIETNGSESDRKSSVDKPVHAKNGQSLENLSHEETTDEKHFDQFFVSASSLQSESPEIEESSFESIVGNREQMLGFRQRVRVNRKNLSKNPLKILAARLSPDDDSSGSASVSEAAESSDKQKPAPLNTHLSPEALAALASKEDYSAIKLKRPVISTKGYPHPMLIMIKGKRFVQTKLVCPAVSSLNNGDCFILVTGADEVYQYIGEYSNRMERSKSAEVLAAIKRKKDLGCGPNAVFYTIEQPCQDEPLYEKFLSTLGGGVPYLTEDKLGDEYDEEYESGAIAANRVFQVDFKNQCLTPMPGQPGWGTLPKHSLFADDRSVFVFDFGSEMYAWSGSRAEPEVKKLGTKLAREMFESTGLNSESTRPSWCWFKKVVQFMEPILFREKFFDWPDDGEGRLKYNHMRREKGVDDNSDYSFNFEPCDPEEMLNSWSDLEDAGLVLECFNVGRGKEVRDEVERRTYVITTLDAVFCHISNFSTEKPPPICHFYATETYVIRWSYYVTHTSRDLKGGVSKHAGTRVGRDRIAYFFWHGAESKITEKGVSALMTVELDEEKGPQIRVDQGAEPPAFLVLFKGLMFIHSGSPEECGKREMRLYVAMGGVEEEGHFMEVAAEPSSFRSRSSFLLLTGSRVFLWHGFASSAVSRKIASRTLEQMTGSKNEFTSTRSDKLQSIVLKEGEETEDFLRRLGVGDTGEWRESYGSTVNASSQPATVTIFFRFTSIKGSFEAVPVSSARRSASIYDPFPILQEELLSAQQPALFLISTHERTWLWQGRMHEADDENVTTGSQKFRWAAERKAALESAISFSEHRHQEGFLLHTGREPPEFRALFPYWKAQTPECLQGNANKACISLLEAIQPYRKRTFSLEELQTKPDGVDVLKLETYLSDTEFVTLLKLNRKEFERLQPWKKMELKKQVGLF